MRKDFISPLAFSGTFFLATILTFTPGCSKGASDDTIAKDVQSKIEADPVTKDSQVNVTAQDGKVIIKGAAKDQATQQRMEQIARDEPGAKGVDDETALLSAATPDQSSNTA